MTPDLFGAGGGGDPVTQQHVTVPSDNKPRMCGSDQRQQQEDSAVHVSAL